MVSCKLIFYYECKQHTYQEGNFIYFFEVQMQMIKGLFFESIGKMVIYFI